MRSIVISGCIVLTLVIGVFAFTLGNMSHPQEGMGCVASWVERALCPQGENAFLSALFHLKAFENVSQGVVSQVNIMGLLIALVLVSFIAERGINGFFPIERRREEWCGGFFYPSPCLGTSMVSWLAFHENSPAYQ